MLIYFFTRSISANLRNKIQINNINPYNIEKEYAATITLLQGFATD